MSSCSVTMCLLTMSEAQTLGQEDASNGPCCGTALVGGVPLGFETGFVKAVLVS